MLEQVDLSDTCELASKPAAKILDFFRDFEKVKTKGQVQFNTAHGIAASETMANLKPVSRDWMEIWLDQWGF